MGNEFKTVEVYKLNKPGNIFHNKEIYISRKEPRYDLESGEIVYDKYYVRFLERTLSEQPMKGACMSTIDGLVVSAEEIENLEDEQLQDV